jgi:pyruvate/2-oxoglutarate dehydrogenase complex dihydrolipoamide dehydrogenase (E3) component
VPYLTNETVFQLNAPVSHLIVLGAGPIGMEMAQTFVRLGNRVTVIAPGQHILPREDSDLTRPLSEVLSRKGIEFLLNHKPNEISGGPGAIRLEVSGPTG